MTPGDFMVNFVEALSVCSRFIAIKDLKGVKRIQ